jgi:RNA polymerase sigma-70 factor (ECF subfamily)
MEALVRRDSDAMAAIYGRYESTLRAVILSVLHEEGETDDVLHDVFIQLWNHADRFVAEKGLHGFLVTLARRRALDRLKPTNFDLSELLRGMIRLLPGPQQEVVQLTFFEGMSQREIAARQSIALGTVKTRLQLAQKKLLNQLVPILNKI